MNIIKLQQKRKLRRKLSIRNKIYGQSERPRLSVTRSNVNIFAQIISDDEKKTIISASTIDKEVKGLLKPQMTKTEQSQLVGKVLADRAKKANISKVVFDRNGFIYAGRIKALADAAREGGLEF